MINSVSRFDNYSKKKEAAFSGQRPCLMARYLEHLADDRALRRSIDAEVITDAQT
jgi:signal transduction protein with GAF and PtsI domain